MAMRAGLVVGFLVAAVTACGKAGPAHVGADGMVSKLDFQDAKQRALLEDPTRQEQAGFGYGEWVVADGVLKQVRGSADNLASHLKYAGDAFGTKGGEAPSRYRAAIDVSAYQETQSPQVAGSPTGVLSFLPYYRDPTHYMLLAASRHTIEVWAVDGLRPAGDVWPAEARVFSEWLPNEIKVGDVVHWQAEVDTGARTMRVWYGDTEKAALHLPGLTDATHYVAVSSNGNFVAYDNLSLYYLGKKKTLLGLGFLGL